MATRTIQAPGLEWNILDRSYYEDGIGSDFSTDAADSSLIGTVSLVCGFADKGQDYKTQWVNSIQTLNKLYGKPTTEPERYFYNAAVEVLNRQGVLLMAKLPYDNEAKDCYTYCEYEVKDTDRYDYRYYQDIQNIDKTVQTHVLIESNGNCGKMATTEYDSLLTNTRAVGQNKIQIVDITRNQYGSLNLLNDDSYNQVECLGIVPVLVSPMNALFYQHISSDTAIENDSLSVYEVTDGIELYNCVSQLKNINGDMLTDFDKRNFSIKLSSDNKNDSCISKIAANTFPKITFDDVGCLDREFMKQIGVVVFKAVRDESNDRITFNPIESFVGSFDRRAVNKDGASIFIDNIINANSKYINFFSNVLITENYRNSDTMLIANQTATVLGFQREQCTKNISYTESIIKPLTYIFDFNNNPLRFGIDIVIDAGVSNIAQFVKTCENIANSQSVQNEYNVDADAQAFVNSLWYPALNDNAVWALNDENDTTAWRNVINKYDTFAKNIRKDCIFIADGLRTFCLAGEQKLVRETYFDSTIANTILPKLKYMSGINSSYTAGYCNWFQIMDDYSGQYFWCPPSIKAAGLYIYTDTYFQPWDAPAGVRRGVVSNAIDTAFSPTHDEAGKIYAQCWNYAMNYPFEGVIVEGQKTMQIKHTSLDRVNVRRLVLYLEKQVREVAKYFTYELNTDYLRQRFVDAITPIFEDAVENYGISEYAIKCDATINTQQEIENHELHCIVGIKPIKTIEFIVIDFMVGNQSMNISETVQNF